MKIGTVDPTLLEKNLAKRIEEDIRSQRVGGAAVAVLQHGKLLYEGFLACSAPDRVRLCGRMRFSVSLL